MARPLWKGHISFGLVQVPVSLFPAETRSELHFHMVDSRNSARIRYERVNEVTGEEVPWDAVAKAYEYDGGKMVLLNDEDFRHADVKATRLIELDGFVDRKSLDCVYFDKPYALVPDKKGEKGYVILREALERTGKAGVARVVIRAREYVAVLLPRGNALFLNLLRYAPELKAPAEFDVPSRDLDKHGVSRQELALAEQVIDSRAVAWDPARYKDAYRDALMRWIKQKIRLGDKAPAHFTDEQEPADTEPDDILDRLRKSVRPRRGEPHGARPR